MTNITPVKSARLTYEGSVKRVWQPTYRADCLWFEFTDDYSVFDWGKMPDTIANKGKALTLIGAAFFERFSQPELWEKLPQMSFGTIDTDWLKAAWSWAEFSEFRKNGPRSHFKGLTNPDGQRLTIVEAAWTASPVYMEVLRAEVNHPSPAVVLGQTVYHYESKVSKVKAPKLIPLEVVFRFGMPSGSSLKERLDKDPDYMRVLGLETLPLEGKMFDRPVLEFFTKLEPKDRLLSVQEALLISGLTPRQFESLARRATLYALALFAEFSKKGIELWDGKFEFILDGEEILLADSIGPDELRLLVGAHQLSKEMIRQVYRDSKWAKSLKEAQKIAANRQQHDWKTICKEELKSTPEPLSADFKKIVDRLYGVLANEVAEQQLFADHPSLEKFVASIPTVAKS